MPHSYGMTLAAVGRAGIRIFDINKLIAPNPAVSASSAMSGRNCATSALLLVPRGAHRGRTTVPGVEHPAEGEEQHTRQCREERRDHALVAEVALEHDGDGRGGGVDL